jgi:cbb3-type cytochrome oxidase maturation protein
MSVILLLLVASILVAGGFLIAFIYSVKTGQYDDEQSPPMRMLFDNMPIKEQNAQVSDTTKLNKELKLTNK